MLPRCAISINTLLIRLFDGYWAYPSLPGIKQFEWYEFVCSAGSHQAVLMMDKVLCYLVGRSRDETTSSPRLYGCSTCFNRVGQDGSAVQKTGQILHDHKRRWECRQPGLQDRWTNSIPQRCDLACDMGTAVWSSHRGNQISPVGDRPNKMRSVFQWHHGHFHRW